MKIHFLDGLDGSGKSRFIERRKEIVGGSSALLTGGLIGIGSAEIKRLTPLLADYDDISPNLLYHIRIMRLNAFWGSFLSVFYENLDRELVYIERSPAAIIFYEELGDLEDDARSDYMASLCTNNASRMRARMLALFRRYGVQVRGSFFTIEGEPKAGEGDYLRLCQFMFGFDFQIERSNVETFGNEAARCGELLMDGDLAEIRLAQDEAIEDSPNFFHSF
ncbi:MAG: hypothetical protein ACRCX2_34785 [Paraclostridium sp.]